MRAGLLIVSSLCSLAALPAAAQTPPGPQPSPPAPFQPPGPPPQPTTPPRPPGGFHNPAIVEGWAEASRMASDAIARCDRAGYAAALQKVAELESLAKAAYEAAVKAPQFTAVTPSQANTDLMQVRSGEGFPPYPNPCAPAQEPPSQPTGTPPGGTLPPVGEEVETERTGYLAYLQARNAAERCDKAGLEAAVAELERRVAAAGNAFGRATAEAAATPQGARSEPAPPRPSAC